MEEYNQKGIYAFDGIVVRSARRTAMCNALRARLFPFGKFKFLEGSNLEKWSQNLLVEKGFFESDCLYASGMTIHSTGFIHPEYNIYALRKTFEYVNGKKEVTYNVKLCGYNESISQYMHVLYVKRQDTYIVLYLFYQ